MSAKRRSVGERKNKKKEQKRNGEREIAPTGIKAAEEETKGERRDGREKKSGRNSEKKK
jgi:hypothetical protein